jgi:hypothetical protein
MAPAPPPFGSAAGLKSLEQPPDRGALHAQKVRTIEQVEPRFAPVPIAATEAVEETAKVLPEHDRRVRPAATTRIGWIEIDPGGRRRIRADAR